MNYTFTNEKTGKEKTVSIPEDYIRTNCRNLDITVRECCDMWLSDNGYVKNEIIERLTAKATKSGVKAQASSGTRKKPTRKPDYVKRELIDAFFSLLDNDEKIENVNVENIERLITFTIGSDNYSLTLAKKRVTK